MMKTKQNQQAGFGHLIVLVAVVVILALGGSGYAVYHAHHKKAPESKSTTTNQSTKSTSTTGSSTTGKSTPAVTYFTIKEWGVQAPYSGSDLSYSPGPDGSSLMLLESQAVDATIPPSDTSPSCRAGNAGLIGRYLPNDYVAGTIQITAQSYVTQNSSTVYSKIGSYYYIYVPPTAGCSTDVPPVDQAMTAAESIVKNLTTVQ
jgi:hypothetical protein